MKQETKLRPIKHEKKRNYRTSKSIGNTRLLPCDLFTLVAWLAVFAWMVVIYNLSAQNAVVSNNLSGTVTEVVVDTIETIVPTVTLDVDTTHYYIRKNAHFFAYLLLGILVCIASMSSNYGKLARQGWKRSSWDNRIVLVAMVICVLYAMGDEYHQTMIPGRSGEWRDVGIDSVGALLGIGVFASLMLLFRRRKQY